MSNKTGLYLANNYSVHTISRDIPQEDATGTPYPNQWLPRDTGKMINRITGRPPELRLSVDYQERLSPMSTRGRDPTLEMSKNFPRKRPSSGRRSHHFRLVGFSFSFSLPRKSNYLIRQKSFLTYSIQSSSPAPERVSQEE